MMAGSTSAVTATLALSDALWRIIWLRDYNTRIVLLGTVLLGLAAGLLGVYLLLRRRVLIGDAISHATLPGVVIAFLWSVSLGQEKSLGWLLLGAAVSGALGGMAVLFLRHAAKIREDAALGIVLSVFFGAGVVLLSIAQQSGGNAAGLESFIYGKAAAMTSEDVWLCGAAAGLVFLITGLLGKELRILCFDIELARSQGWPVLLLDALLIGLVVVVTVVGLQAVGLILIIALLVIPASSARFWTHDLRVMLPLSAVLGAISCTVGTIASATLDKLPSGAAIVLAACALFIVSFAFGNQRGVWWRLTRMWELRREQDEQHLLRAMVEHLEARSALPSLSGELKSSEAVELASLLQHRNWSWRRARRWAVRLSKKNLVVYSGGGTLQLTPRGLLRAVEYVREHRLLERYLMERASAHVAQADREADYLEHALLPEHLAELSNALREEVPHLPPNPHPLD